MSQSRQIWEQLRWDLLALVILIAGVAIYAVLQQPRLYPAQHPQTQGSKPPDRTEGDVLLIVPNAPAARAVDFETLDCTFTWFNILWQHFGTFATTSIDTLTPQLLSGHTMVVVPSRVAAEMGSTGRDHLDEFARQGGQLVVETPRQEWAGITGLSTIGAINRAQQITSIEGLGADNPLSEHLFDVPLAGRLLPSGEVESGPADAVLFEIDDQPGLVARELDDGNVYSLLFDFSCSLLAMHQGKPTRDLKFGAPDEQEWLPTASRVAHENLLATAVPYAELLQRSLLERLPERRPMPRLWPYPGDARGAAMTIHPAETSPRAAFGYADRARRQDAHSTLFIAPDFASAEHAALAAESNADIGLLWVLGQRRTPIAEGVGVGAIAAWHRELSLPRQRTGLEMALGTDRPVTQVRTEGTLWKSDWDGTFRTMAAAGLRFDTSFGPVDAAHYGYLFGTGMPFYPLDDRGRPFPVLEVPFVLDGANITTDRLEELLSTSQEGLHQPLVVSLGADAMEKEPSVGILLGYRAFHDLARDHEHWLTTVADYADFLAARRHSVITSQWSEDEHRLTVSVNLVGAKLDTKPEGAIPSIAVPEEYENRGIERIEIDDEEVEFTASATSGTGRERLIELPAGRHVVSVFYESPPPDGEDGS